MTQRCLLVPAVHQDGPGERRVDRLHLLQELEHSDGREGNSKVGPAGEVELRDQPRSFVVAVAGLLSDETQKKKGRVQPRFVRTAVCFFQGFRKVWPLGPKEELRPLVCTVVLQDGFNH